MLVCVRVHLFILFHLYSIVVLHIAFQNFNISFPFLNDFLCRVVWAQTLSLYDIH